jgi:hypothetical protein
MPFVMRWYELRRLNSNNDPADDIIVSKQMYDFDVNGVKTPKTVKTYTLEKNSNRYVLPIPLSEIISGNGVIVKNQY